MNPTENERLYGLPYAESMDFELSTVYDRWHDDFADDEPKPDVVIEEWTVHPADDHLPHIDRLMDWLVEWVCENGEIDEDATECWESAARCEDVTLAFAEAMDLLASKVTYRMADELVAIHTVTHDADGNPMLDGEPLYRPVTP